jgi:hypothetical protein
VTMSGVRVSSQCHPGSQAMFLVALGFEVPAERPIGAFNVGSVVKHLCFADVPRARGPSARTAHRSSAASADEDDPRFHTCSRQAGPGSTCDCGGCQGASLPCVGLLRQVPGLHQHRHSSKCVARRCLGGRLVGAPAAASGVKVQAAV